MMLYGLYSIQWKKVLFASFSHFYMHEEVIVYTEKCQGIGSGVRDEWDGLSYEVVSH